MTLGNVAPAPFATAIEQVISACFPRTAVAATADQYGTGHFVASLGDIINSIFGRRRGEA
jgi:hypothetical protein